MARSSSGKSVARAAATGGGATYRGQMPVNWYAALAVIVLVGLASVALAKYHYDQRAAVVEPTTTTTWHGGLAFDICGTVQPALTASPSTASTGLTTTGEGVLLIAPKNASEAGNNATLGKFAQGYTGLTLTNTTLKYPATSVPEYRNGEKCAAGTPDAGKVGEVQARWWLLTTKTEKNGEVKETDGVSTFKPADLKFADRQLITVGFVPDNVTLPKPPATTITGLLQVLAGTQPVATTTTTAPVATTTTTPAATSSTTTTTTTTTASSTTTTKPPSSTTTTK
jgi:cell division septation protein DedD